MLIEQNDEYYAVRRPETSKEIANYLQSKHFDDDDPIFSVKANPARAKPTTTETVNKRSQPEVPPANNPQRPNNKLLLAYNLTTYTNSNKSDSKQQKPVHVNSPAQKRKRIVKEESPDILIPVRSSVDPIRQQLNYMA